MFPSNHAGIPNDMALPLDLDLNPAMVTSGMGHSSLDAMLHHQPSMQMDLDLNTLDSSAVPPTPHTHSQHQHSASGLTPQHSLPYNNMPQAAQAHMAASHQDPNLIAASNFAHMAPGIDLAGSTSSGPGAGPLPMGFGQQPPPGSGSTLTEFTKRRNWSQRVIEEMRDFLCILTTDCRIMWSSPSCKTLTGFEPQQLYGKFLQDYVHQDDNGVFIREFNECIATGNTLRFYYRFRKPDDSFAIFECHGHPHHSSDAAQVSGIPYCTGVFLMSRPYPTKNATLLDSFLEHKIENERLTKKIAELKREEQEEQEQMDQQILEASIKDASSTTHATPAGSLARTESDQSRPGQTKFRSMPPPAKPTISNIALTRQNLDEALATSRPDSINDKMARYEGASHVDTIEMLTGLRYRDGERSQGISTGAESPNLIRGDAGIAISIDKDRGNREDKKKKLKVADEYVCTDCGTLDSPEWRKGPNGPKTLCNACGLRWAKKEKKRQSASGPSSSQQQQSQTGHHIPGLLKQSSTGSGTTNTTTTTATTTKTMDHPDGGPGRGKNVERKRTFDELEGEGS